MGRQAEPAFHREGKKEGEGERYMPRRAREGSDQGTDKPDGGGMKSWDLIAQQKSIENPEKKAGPNAVREYFKAET